MSFSSAKDGKGKRMVYSEAFDFKQYLEITISICKSFKLLVIVKTS